MLTETPMHPHHGALTQTLRNRAYKTHYQQGNAPSPKGTLPEARLPPQCTHNGGGCWIAYKKSAPWAPSVRPLPLPGPCPKHTTCAIELTLHSGAKAAIIACYLPQEADAHTRTCKALSELPTALPHHALILGGDFQGNWHGPNTKDAAIRTLPFRRWEGPVTPTFTPPSKLDQATCIDHLAIWDPIGLTA